ncbi:MAG: hypothetical protein IKO41_09015 [Lachnospiraceae bacterium]|nr:hypothetical protein [Lachnospiraceae bacterium]
MKERVTMAQTLTRYAWSGYCLTLAMYTLVGECWITGDAASERARKAIIEAKGHFSVYDAFKEEGGVTRTILRFYAYLATNVKNLEKCATELLITSEGKGGISGDSLRMALRQEMAIFTDLFGNGERVSEISRYAANQLRTNLYDFELGREAKVLYDRIESWWD